MFLFFPKMNLAIILMRGIKKRLSTVLFQGLWLSWEGEALSTESIFAKPWLEPLLASRCLGAAGLTLFL